MSRVVNINQNRAEDLINQINQVIKEPLIIQKDGKSHAVLISNEEYKRFLELEDFCWTLRAEQASKNGFLSNEESKNFLDSILKS